MKIILITGAGSGIGYETAVSLKAQGHKIYGGVRDQRSVEKLTQSGIIPLELDITDERPVSYTHLDVYKRQMHISPINISVHTVDPALRVKMMKNKHAGDVLRYIDEFAEAGIEINCQLVLCRGINDGDKLRESLEKLAGLHPSVQSIAAVPAGLTRYRENLYPLTPYDQETAGEVLDILEEYGNRFKQRHGVRIVYPGDEWYLLAGRPIPPYDFYDSFCQLENGVGMWRLLHDEFMEALPEMKKPFWPRRIDLATGELAYPLIKTLADTLQTMCRSVHITVHCIRNDFFGGNVTVAGLITGTDLKADVYKRQPSKSPSPARRRGFGQIPLPSRRGSPRSRPW